MTTPPNVPPTNRPPLVVMNRTPRCSPLPQETPPVPRIKTRVRRRFGAGVLCAAAVLFAALAIPRTLAQATANPPERLTYQGFLVDGNGVALGNNAPRNYDVEFRIFATESGGAAVWGEQQTVTVDKGYFSVLLGEGAAISGVARPALSSLFRGANASDRWVGITVRGIGTSGANVDILPRLRFLSSPYAFLAQQANRLVQDNGNDLLTSSGNQLSLNGGLRISGENILELGAGLTKQTHAGKIGYGIFTPGALDIVGAGTANNNRAIKFFNEGGATFTGPVTVNGGVTATSFTGSGTALTGVAKLAGGNTFSGAQVFNNNVGLGVASPNFPLSFPNSLGSKISLWGQSGNHYGLGIQSSLLQIHTDGTGSAVAFGWGSSAAFNETMRVANSGRVTLNGGFLARGGYPGSAGVNNNGYAFSGNGGDNDSGMFSDQDGHVRFTSNNALKMSVYPSGVYAHDRLHANNGVSINTGWGQTAEITTSWLTLYHRSDKGKRFEMDRVDTGVRIWATGGGFGNNSSFTRQIVWDGDGNWDASSDRNLKKDIEDAEPVLDRALQVRLRRFRWADEADEADKSLGVIAQELQPLFPEMVGETSDKDTEEKHLTVGYSDFGMIAIKALQEFKAEHDAEVAGLKAQLADLQAQMTDVLRVNAELLSRIQQSPVTAVSR